MTSSDALEVFQDLVLQGPDVARAALRAALIARAIGPWRHAQDREQHLAKLAGEAEVLAFERAGGDGVDAVGLVLWENEGGYEVTNIVPLETGELGPRRYNQALQDFVEHIAREAAAEAGFSVHLTPARQGMTDWLPPDAADALKRFSGAANKATGSSHPMDRKRWLAFLIAVHGSGGILDADRLVRWLVEAEGWSDDIAHELAIQYEFGLALLDEYDSARA